MTHVRRPAHGPIPYHLECGRPTGPLRPCTLPPPRHRRFEPRPPPRDLFRGTLDPNLPSSPQTTPLLRTPSSRSVHLPTAPQTGLPTPNVLYRPGASSTGRLHSAPQLTPRSSRTTFPSPAPSPDHTGKDTGGVQSRKGCRGATGPRASHGDTRRRRSRHGGPWTTCCTTHDNLRRRTPSLAPASPPRELGTRSHPPPDPKDLVIPLHPDPRSRRPRCNRNRRSWV